MRTLILLASLAVAGCDTGSYIDANEIDLAEQMCEAHGGLVRIVSAATAPTGGGESQTRLDVRCVDSSRIQRTYRGRYEQRS